MPALKIGDIAPDFSLPDGENKLVSLRGFRGKKVVLYFYPKDDTSGCTREACDFTENYASIKQKGAVVLGVSADSPASHRKFSEKYNLTFPLISDGEKKIIKAYGVWKKKSMYGREYMGIERTTFVIDENGRISALFSKVKVNGHVEEILSIL